MAASDAHVIVSVDVKDVRFPTSLEGDGSDAMHTDPDYSCAYVILTTSLALKGHGLTFTIGKGTEIVVQAVKSMCHLVVGQKLKNIFDDFSSFWRKLTSDSQLRWVGPEKGVIHLATAAVVNALWDLWGKAEGKPVWKLLTDMTPEQIVSLVDFRYITDALTPDEALAILKQHQSTKHEREAQLVEQGYPAYTTSVAWLGYSDDKIEKLGKQALDEGWTKFKVKVGADKADDIRRCTKIRDMIGWENTLMVDANQRWDVAPSIDYMRDLAQFKPLWIEEPTSPDDILGHAAIAKALQPLGIGVATGEQCHNRVMFKQFLQAGAMQFCQIDSCRLGGVNEIIAVLLLAAKFKVPVCPHAGGLGLCELVQHMAIFDYICVSASLENRVTEFVDHLHEHFVNPVIIRNAAYIPPQAPGYSSELKQESLDAHTYPGGSTWQMLFHKGIFKSN